MTDEAGHENDINLIVREVRALNDAVMSVLSWAEGRSDTLIIVTADHETGGLQVLEDNGQGHPPTVSWSTAGHTSENVKIFVRGVDAETFFYVLENVDIYRILIRYFL